VRKKPGAWVLRRSDVATAGAVGSATAETARTARIAFKCLVKRIILTASQSSFHKPANVGCVLPWQERAPTLFASERAVAPARIGDGTLGSALHDVNVVSATFRAVPAINGGSTSRRVAKRRESQPRSNLGRN